MTQEHITITEEVVKDGVLVTQQRETLQHTPDTSNPASGNPAYSVLNPDYVSAQDRVYTYNEATGMSESEPAEVNEVVAVEADEVDDSEDETEEAEEPVLCLHPVGNGECQLESGHEGQHRLNVD